MKQANNNEVDLLLRSLALGGKRAAWQVGSETGAEEQVASDHLDADELNAYAEGVAPAPARARYTEHLADCAACRGLVVQLTQAAGVANRLAVPEQKGGAGFWQKLSEFFSPTVLRFAVPLVVLTIVIGVGFLALRQPKGDLLARNEQPNSAAPVVQTNDGPGSAAQPQPTVQNSPHSLTIDQTAKEPVAQPKKAEAGEESDLASGYMKAPAKDSGQPVDNAGVSESRPYAFEPKAAAPPPPVTVFDNEKSAEVAKDLPARREDQKRDQDEGFRMRQDDVHGPNRSSNNQIQSANNQRGNSGLAAGRGPSGMDKNKKMNEVETRSVMGRNFTREGDAWVDTAYESSRTIVRVKRGSDQFRALVADEPAIRTIAEQLSGVVIVVWKSRTYRIQ